MDSDRYKVGDRLVSTDDKDYQLRIEEEFGMYGTWFKYRTKIVTTDPQLYYPHDLLDPETEYIHMGSFYGEASSDYGSVAMDTDVRVEFFTYMNDTGYQIEVSN
jgi:hypothetical protein